jgi:hypothetical protein
MMNLPGIRYPPIVLLSLMLMIWVAVIVHSQSSPKLVGSVADQLSVPIPGARISLYSIDRILQTTSDLSGRFQFESVPLGTYQLEIAAPGFKSFVKDSVNVTEQMRTVAGDKPLEFTVTMQIAPTGSAHPEDLGPITVDTGASCGHRDSVSYSPAKTNEGGILDGVVASANPSAKSPIAEARVLLIDIQGAQLAEQHTNERGEFQFKQVRAGRYSVEVRPAGYSSLKSYVFWIARENETHVTLAPVPVGMIVVCQ